MARFDAAVVGAGIVGLTTAYRLSRAGLRVCVLDRASRVASHSSHMSAGQIEPPLFTGAAAISFPRPRFPTRGL
ncbi:hypothetical protein T492DRAFT_890996 [Pavlovales sp. CCMP2436]|nr:hypothetical protein T492DRAFT_890996 [Pavlovales sp. CCMP2436]